MAVNTYIYIAKLKYPGPDVEERMAFSSKKALFDYYGEEIVGLARHTLNNIWPSEERDFENDYIQIKRYKFCAGKCPEIMERVEAREDSPFKGPTASRKAEARITMLNLKKIE